MSGQIRDLWELHPSFRPRVEQWLANCSDRGYGVYVVETRRSMAVAEAYYAQGREPLLVVAGMRAAAGLPPLPTADYSKVITRARPGFSWHIYGLAIDVVPHVNGVLDWAYDANDTADFYDEIANEATKLGMSWGGRWRTFKDYPHVEWHPGYTNVADAYRLYLQRKKLGSPQQVRNGKIVFAPWVIPIGG